MTEIQLPLFTPNSNWRPPEDLPDLSEAGIISLDVETCDPNLKKLGPGAIRNDGYLVGVSLATDRGHRMYLPVAHAGGGNLDIDIVKIYLREQLGRAEQVKIGANILYDLEFLTVSSIAVRGRLIDVQTVEALLNETRMSYSLNDLSIIRCDETKDETMLNEVASAYGIDPKAELWKLPSWYVGPYAEQDAVLPLRIYEKQAPLLEEQGLNEVADLESRLLSLALLMRLRGVPVDLDAAGELNEQWIKDQRALRDRMFEEYQVNLNPWSGPTIARICQQRGIQHPMTARGNPSITKDFIATSDDPFLQLVLEMRTLDRLRGTFVDDLIFGHQVNGKIHAQFHSTRREEGGTRSGRWSSSNPNLQQVPARDKKYSALIRALFIAEEGYQWAKLDYSQQEPRILVHYASTLGLTGAEQFRDMYNEEREADFYEHLMGEANIDRFSAKCMTLGRFYGMGKKKMADRLGVGLTEAESLLHKFDRAAPFVRELSYACSRRAEDAGYIKTFLGRRRRFLEWEEYQGKRRRTGTHKALNALIQGTAADMMKVAMINVHEEHQVVPYLTVHDEIGVGVDDRQQAEDIAETMVAALPLTVPMRVDIDLGRHWS